MTDDETRMAMCLDLLRRLARRDPLWAVHGNLDEAFTGDGDLDLLVPEEDWSRASLEVAAWARATGSEAPVVCRHKPGTLVLALRSARASEYLKIELVSHRFFRGALLYQARALSALIEDDDRGFRRLRPGTAGMIKLIPNGIRIAGRAKWSSDKVDGVAMLIAEDPEGALAAAELFGWARPFARSAALALARGRWHQSSLAVVELWAATRALRQPRVLLGRLRHRRTPRCSLLEGPPPEAAEFDAWYDRASIQHRQLAGSDGIES